MIEDLVSFPILYLVVENGPLLDRVESYLNSVGKHELVSSLQKLQEDAGVFVFEGIGDGQEASSPPSPNLTRTKKFFEEPNPEIGPAGLPMEPVDPEKLKRTREIHERLGILTYARFSILDEISSVLEGSAVAKDYEEMMAKYRNLLPVGQPSCKPPPPGIPPSQP
jgi:hypothetical protein